MVDDELTLAQRRDAALTGDPAESSYRPTTVTDFLLTFFFQMFASDDQTPEVPAVAITEPRAEDPAAPSARSVMEPAAAPSVAATAPVDPAIAATHEVDPALSADGFSWKAVGDMYGFDASALERLPADVEIEDSEMTNPNNAFGASWLSAAEALYNEKHGAGAWDARVAEEGWDEGTARTELADYAEARVGWFNNNMGSLGITWARESDEYKATLMYLVEMNERTVWHTSDFGNGAWKMVADVTNIPTAVASFFTFGAAAAGAAAAKEGAKAAVKASAMQMVRSGVKLQLAEAAAFSAADSAMRQDIETDVDDGRGNAMSEFSYTRLAKETALGLGAAIGISGGSYLAGRLVRDTGLGERVSQITAQAWDTAGSAAGAGLDVATLRMWRLPGQAVRAWRDPSSVDFLPNRGRSFLVDTSGNGKTGPNDAGKRKADAEQQQTQSANTLAERKKPQGKIGSFGNSKTIGHFVDNFDTALRDFYAVTLHPDTYNSAARQSALKTFGERLELLRDSALRMRGKGVSSDPEFKDYVLSHDFETIAYLSRNSSKNINSLQQEGIDKHVSAALQWANTVVTNVNSKSDAEAYLKGVSKRVNSGNSKWEVGDQFVVSTWEKGNSRNKPIGVSNSAQISLLKRSLEQGTYAPPPPKTVLDGNDENIRKMMNNIFKNHPVSEDQYHEKIANDLLRVMDEGYPPANMMHHLNDAVHRQEGKPGFVEADPFNGFSDIMEHLKQKIHKSTRFASTQNADGSIEIQDEYAKEVLYLLNRQNDRAWTTNLEGQNKWLQTILGRYLGEDSSVNDSWSSRKMRNRASTAARYRNTNEQQPSGADGGSSSSGKTQFKARWLNRAPSSTFHYLIGSKIDWVQTLHGEKGYFENPIGYQYSYEKMEGSWVKATAIRGLRITHRWTGADLLPGLFRLAPDYLGYQNGVLNAQYLKGRNIQAIATGLSFTGAYAIGSALQQSENPYLSGFGVVTSFPGDVVFGAGNTLQWTEIPLVSQVGWVISTPGDAVNWAVGDKGSSLPAMPWSGGDSGPPGAPAPDKARLANALATLKAAFPGEDDDVLNRAATIAATKLDAAKQFVFSNSDLLDAGKLAPVIDEAKMLMAEELKKENIRKEVVDALEDLGYADPENIPGKGAVDFISNIFFAQNLPIDDSVAVKGHVLNITKYMAERQDRVPVAIDVIAAYIKGNPGLKVSQTAIEKAANTLASGVTWSGSTYSFLTPDLSKVTDAELAALLESSKAEVEKDEKKPDSPDNDDGGSLRIPQSASEAWNSAWEGLHQFSDLDGDGKSEISSGLYAAENFLGGAFNLAGGAFGGRYGKRGQTYAAYGTGIIAALLGTSLIKNVLGISSWPLVGIIIGAVLFFGTSNFAYAAMNGEKGNAGDGDKEGDAQGSGGFVAAAEASKIAKVQNHNGGLAISFDIQMDDDPEAEKVIFHDRDGDGMFVAQVMNVDGTMSYLSPEVIDGRKISSNARFTPGNKSFGIGDVDTQIKLEVIDEAGKVKYTKLTINGKDYTMPLGPMADAEAALDALEPAPQQ